MPAGCARQRFGQDLALQGRVQLLDLAADLEDVLLVGHHPDVGRVEEGQDALHGLLEKRVLAVGVQGQKLLGREAARQRPETGSGAAGQDHGMAVRVFRGSGGVFPDGHFSSFQRLVGEWDI
jgi:hypothetical protein